MESDSVKLVILDIDGVVIRGKTPIPEAIEGIKFLKENNCRVVYLTNNSTRPRQRVLELLDNMGINVSVSDIFTSSYLTALYLSKEISKDSRIFILGEEGIVLELLEAGFRNIIWTNYDPPVDYVVVGMDRNFTFQKLTCAQHAIMSGAKFIATNTDVTFPVENGVIPGGGSIVKAVETASGIKPVVIGKPETLGLRLMLEQLGNVDPEEALFVGDRIETDLIAGKKLGCKTGIVTSGISKRDDLERLPEKLKPDFWGENLLDLLQGGSKYGDRI